ncbi:DNA recombination protein RmuC [Patescibacteria group bacterium]|nr:DNA recombination protein RmuC [Patescibacteria group bacterium]MBU4353652.1 DNA recombination protein RmuC [Patescibacteria group bacterium]MBU4476888.1 DNA recombination protein RmuC [Patescibacteria group bacterium]MCG2699091.1 DNA recombination protein RmuC [Candidatus Parcubacteria bacterium]
MAQFVYIFFAIVAGLIAGAVIFFWARKSGKKEEGNGDSFLMMQEQLKEIRGTLDMKLGESSRLMQQQLGESTRVIQQQFGESSKIIRDVTERLVKLDETNKQVVGFADQLQNLQDILQNPKRRGVLGEYYLETVLKNVLPPDRYQMQYKFNDGEIVDAVIFLDKDKILPIDSKFSLENYNRILEEKNPTEREKVEKIFKQDLKNRIDETAKYIRPKEGTMDFAFMFIPSEAIYYDLLINQVGAVKTQTKDLIEYAFQQRHVIIVSPTSFMAYLQTVLQGLRALQIEESAKEIRKRVEDLGRHLGSYEQFMKKLGANLGATVNTYNSSYKELNKIDKDVLRITGEAIGVEPQMIDKPEEV